MVRTLQKSLQGIEAKIYYIVLVLYYYDPKLPIIVEMDTSDFAIGTILSQKEERVQLVAFYSRKIIQQNSIIISMIKRYWQLFLYLKNREGTWKVQNILFWYSQTIRT
jgi:hypothetical protein